MSAAELTPPPRVLMAIKTNGGVVQINSVADFVKADPKERAPAIAALRA